MIMLHLSFKHTRVFSMESPFLNESFDSSSNDVILCSTPYAVFFSFLLIQMLFMYFLILSAKLVKLITVTQTDIPNRNSNVWSI